MPLTPGDIAMAGTSVESRGRSGAEDGDAVMISGGDMAPVDTDAGDLAGVATNGGLGKHGAFVVAVATGVADGQRLAGGDTTGGSVGELVADANGPALALCDEGGTWHSRDIADGYAVVELCVDA